VALRQDWSDHPCPIARALDVAGDPWVVLVVREALFGARRFEQFRDRLRVADNVLSRRLARMVADGLMVKEPYRGRQRTHDEYVLTEAGADLLPVLDALAKWGGRYTEVPAQHTEMSVVHDGHRSTNATVCSECGAALTVADRSYQREWISA
jgi:DNA-binding HxlR family transcriptional regulator